MSSDYVTRLLFGAVLLLLAVGGVDALTDRQFDSVAIFAMAATGVIIVMVRVVFLRPVVRIRPDHVVWLHERAVDGEESVAAVVDRAIGAHRAGLTGDDHVHAAR